MKHILAVDDNPVNLVMVREYLQDLCKVSVVTSGKQALSFLEKKEVDLILLDVLMPEMDGIETLREIVKMEKVKCKTVMLTALSDDDTIELCKSYGATGYIEKPFTPEDIRNRVSELLGD